MSAILCFAAILLSSFSAIPAIAQTNSEEVLWQRIQQEVNNDDIIDYVVDYPEGERLLDVENILYKKCLKNQEVEDCHTYLALFESTNGRYIDAVNAILEQAVQKEDPKGNGRNIPGIFIENLPEIIEEARELLTEQKKEQEPTKGSMPAQSAPAPSKRYSVLITFATVPEKVTINGRTIPLTRMTNGSRIRRQIRVFLPAGIHTLRVYQKGSKLLCAKKLRITKSTTIKMPCAKGVSSEKG